MKKYEGMFIIKADLAKEGLEKTATQVQDIIKKQDGSLDNIKEWGKQKLAYPIKKHKEGVYYLIDFHIDTTAIAKIRRSFSLNESILRVLITEQA
ncbi:MAG: 30S ribosomal protein S6 [Candidatus Omnitrophica bacterium]|nr:30S ribosomal protein S6 [Candidatus Omnitrophota bacterium]MBU4589689.1 30S ribosomal protein S6 [Candidatus Omnitrophota bacterium]